MSEVGAEGGEAAHADHGDVVEGGDDDQGEQGGDEHAAIPPIPPKHILYKKHVENGILYHYTATDPLPDSTPVPANFEDAYVALLMRHDASQ